ncbi:MAG TPA: carboxypeptidase-like regulatory domain-containing protein [Pirellulaceae bacterium]|nr:carboxypeptidase-like regulatory domain-containing protein [Pirellulaceae bacterium]
MTRITLTCLCLLVLTAAGCGAKYQTAPVSGTITLDGQPLGDATVTFTPEAVGLDAPTSSGRTDASGNYTLALIVDGSPGALVGKHTVVVAPNVESESDVYTPEEMERASLPPSQFAFQVEPGENQADFKLTSASEAR